MCSENLAPYAVTENVSKGRHFQEEKHPIKSVFEVDRDRIIHCSAFRRLEGKTQVFMPGRNDQYRTRMTHSIEVASVGRTIAKALKANQNLTEAICLAHDLGHSPFGHVGEKTLAALMQDNGGFEHNKQTIRIVELLEHPFDGFQGLNLNYETLLGLSRHTSPHDRPEHDEYGEANCTIEGQIADIADRIAYNCHDLEDGLRSRLISDNLPAQIELYEQACEQINASAIEDIFVRRQRIARVIQDILINDAVNNSRLIITESNLTNPESITNFNEHIVKFSSKIDKKLSKLEHFLIEKLYRSEKLAGIDSNIKVWLGRVFAHFCDNPEKMPGYFQSFIPGQGLERTVCDYIAGMTDRYCLSIAETLQG